MFRQPVGRIGRGAVLACMVLVLSGCGGSGNPETHPVSGIVLHNGQPLPNVVVTFYPEKGRSATGRADNNGRFTLTTFEPDDGALPGQHKVTVTPVPEAALEDSSELTAADYEAPATGPSVPYAQKYLSQEMTDLVVKIPEDTEGGEFKLELKE